MTLKQRKILVAGGTGLIGTHLVERLHSLGADIRATCFSRTPDTLREFYQRVDFTDPDQALAVVEGAQDVFFSAAQIAGVAGMKNQPTASIVPNLQINVNLLEACRIHGVERMVFLSSSTVYPEADHPVSETDLDLNIPPYELYSVVGGTARYLEQLCHFYHRRYGMKIGIVRPSSVYGPHDRFEEGNSHVLPALIRRAVLRERPFKVWGDGSVVRDFIFVEDLVEGLLKVLEEYCVCDPLNVGSGEGISIREAVQFILETTAHNVTPEYDARQPTAVAYRVLDTSKFHSLFGRSRYTPLREGLEKTVAWYRAKTGCLLSR